MNHRRSLCLVALLIPFGVGCNPPINDYRPNKLHAASLSRESSDSDPARTALQVASVIKEWFGPPDDPKWPDAIDCPLDWEAVRRCSGPVGRAHDKVERGIYRKHCVQCHGVAGDGVGPAAMLLSPYPRDFRRGTFKFKSTPIGHKPTRDDLRETLERGIPGTSMPAFSTLNQSPEFAKDIGDLVEYVRFLAIRGEVERNVLQQLIANNVELDAKSNELRELIAAIASKWKDAENHVASIPEPPELDSQQLAASIERGKSLFQSELTACSKCHGSEGRGDGASQDFDVWTKDWTILAGIDPAKKNEWKEMKPFGALKPVLDLPRNLAWGGFRGGSSRTDLFRRLVIGIEGSPMPPVARKENGNPGLEDDQIWDLVHFVQSLSSKPSSRSESSSQHAN